jgi:hypothetical protein
MSRTARTARTAHRTACTAACFAALAAACARPASSTAPTPGGGGAAASEAAATGAAPAAWPGTYDLVAVGYREGPRAAVMTVTRSDTGYVMAIQGPPGRGLSQRFAGDSAHAVWLIAEGDTLFVDLRLVRDSVHGRSRGRTLTAAVEGRRR